VAAPVAHFKFEESSGSVLQESSYSSINGAIIGSGSDLNVSGQVGSGYKPGGNGSYGLVSNGVSLFEVGGNSARSISFWFKTPNFTGDEYRLIGAGSSGGAKAFNIVAEAFSGRNLIGLRYGNGNIYFGPTNDALASFALNTWYHVVVVYDGTTLDLETGPSDGEGLIFYVNGVEINSSEGNRTNGDQVLDTTLSDFAFGANTDGTKDGFPGTLDEVQVFNHALASTDVATLASGAGGALPQIFSFTFTEKQTLLGNKVTFSWSVLNHDTLTIEPGMLDVKALTSNGSGSASVIVDATTTYSLVAANNINFTIQSVEIPVANPAPVQSSLWTQWYRPVDQPVFATNENHHDAVIFYEPDATYPYHLIVSHETTNALLYRAQNFSWDSSNWELVEGNYQIDGHYEYDDGVKVNGTYYIFEGGKVYTYTGDLANSSGQWIDAGDFPVEQCDDVGVFYEDGLFHIFGEFGNFPHGPDGTSLSHFTSSTGLGNWTLVNTKAVDPNPDGGNTFGVGDATIIKVDGIYYLFCDRESLGSPYKVTAWSSPDLNQPFKYLGVAVRPRSNETDDWDNYRIQDADIFYDQGLKRFVMMCNMMDNDGDQGTVSPVNFPHFIARGTMGTRVLGTFYSKVTDGGLDAFIEGFPNLTGIDAQANADPDNDGASNLEEYASGTLPDDATSFPFFKYGFVEDGGMDYPAILFDRITIDPLISRDGQASITGSLDAASFSMMNGVEILTGTSDKGAFFEQVIWRSLVPVPSTSAQFLRVSTKSQ